MKHYDIKTPTCFGFKTIIREQFVPNKVTFSV